MKAQGMIKAVIKKRGYGFLEAIADGSSYFFHASIVEGDAYEQLKPLDYVEFEPDTGPRGNRALKVALITDPQTKADIDLWREQQAKPKASK